MCCQSLPLTLFLCYVLTHLLEANVCDVPQDTFQRLSPLSVSQRILLTPDDIKIVWNMICSVVLRLPLTLTLKPGVDVVGWTSVS